MDRAWPAAGGTCSTASTTFGRRCARWVLNQNCLPGRASPVGCGSGSCTAERWPIWRLIWHTRTFGRWQLQPINDGGATDSGRSSVLVEALVGRLQLRKVAVRTATPVIGIEVDGGRVAGIRTASGKHAAAAVICTVDPWQTVDALLRPNVAKATRRTVHRLQPAGAPAISHSLIDDPIAGVSETVEHTVRGVPTVTYRRPAGRRSIRMVHDFGSIGARSTGAVTWQGFRSFLRRPPVTTEIAGLFLAGPFSAAGAAPSAVVLSSALAAYRCQNYLYSDVRPPE